MRYNSEALEIKIVISGHGLLFKDIKISLGLLKGLCQQGDMRSRVRALIEAL